MEVPMKNSVAASADTGAAIVPIKAGIFPASSPESLTTEQLVEVATGAFQRLQDSMPFIIELRKRFNAAPRGKANISGCNTWEQFCEKHLHRTASALRKALQEEKPKKRQTKAQYAAALAERTTNLLSTVNKIVQLKHQFLPTELKGLIEVCRNAQPELGKIVNGLTDAKTATAKELSDLSKKVKSGAPLSDVSNSLKKYVEAAAVSELTETFYVVRCKRDGKYLRLDSNGDADFVLFTSATHWENTTKLNLVSFEMDDGAPIGVDNGYADDDFEWVKIQATYQLTAVSQDAPAIATADVPEIGTPEWKRAYHALCQENPRYWNKTPEAARKYLIKRNDRAKKSDQTAVPQTKDSKKDNETVAA